MRTRSGRVGSDLISTLHGFYDEVVAAARLTPLREPAPPAQVRGLPVGGGVVDARFSASLRSCTIPAECSCLDPVRDGGGSERCGGDHAHRKRYRNRRSNADRGWVPSTGANRGGSIRRAPYWNRLA